MNNHINKKNFDRQRRFFNGINIILTVSIMLTILIVIPTIINAADTNKTQAASVSPEYLAQWNLNYANYLTDVGKYLEALESYETALEATDNKTIQGNVLMHKASLLSSYLDAPAEALKVYDKLIREYPLKSEAALYQMGLLLFDKGDYKDAIEVFQYYLKVYPRGRFRYSAETLYRRARKETAPPSIIKEGERVEQPYVRVLLHRRASSFELYGKNIIINERAYSGSSIHFTARDNMIYIGDSPFSERIIFKASSNIKVICGSEKKSVRGIIIIEAKDGRLMVINKVIMEQYLRSVVPSESYSTWTPEALKAQAIAGRTYAYYQIIHRTNWAYDVVDNEGDQAYKGVIVESKTSDNAVLDTTGIIAISQGRPILAMYTANNGGYMADAGKIFNLSKSYFVSKPDSYSVKGKMATWDKQILVSQVETNLQTRGINVSGLSEITPAEKDSSGRVIKINIIAQSGGGVFRTRPTLGRALELPEILFDIRRENNYFIFTGKGWGHGVGYSQWGGAIMSQDNYDYKSILGFYYPGAELMKLW